MNQSLSYISQHIYYFQYIQSMKGNQISQNQEKNYKSKVEGIQNPQLNENKKAQRQEDSEDQQYDSSSQDSEEGFKVPEKSIHTNEIFKKYKDSRGIINEQDSDHQQIQAFCIKNLDTGEIFNIENNQGVQEFDKSISRKRKTLKKNNKIAIWESFWKTVYANNQLLRATAQKGDYMLLKRLVLQTHNGYPVEINSKGFDDWTALHFASYEDHYQIVQFLLRHEANVNAKTKFGKTSLHISAMRGHIKIVLLLIKFDIDIEHQDEDGNTGLHIAAQNSQIQVIQCILKLTKSLKQNKLGLTAIDIAPSGPPKDIFFKFGFKQSQDIPQLKRRKTSKTHQDGLLKDSPKKKENNNIQRIRLPQQLELSPNSFIYYSQLGKGAFGQVFLVSLKPQFQKQQDQLHQYNQKIHSVDFLTQKTNNNMKQGKRKFYAMKVMNKSQIFDKKIVRYAMAERDVLSRMNHPFIVKLYYAFQTNQKLYLVMQYCPGGDLGKLISKKKKLEQEEVRMYASELILAFQALHKNMIVFRDLKPDNVVLDSQGHARLTDFGLSKQGIYNNTTESFCGSIAYLAPEVLNKQGHTRTVDWYLLGVLIYELLVGIPPYYSAHKQILFQNIKRGPIKIPKTMSQEAKDLIKKLLCRDPRKRLGALRDAQQIKQHPFFSKINWNDVLNRKLPVPPITFEYPKITQQKEQQRSQQNHSLNKISLQKDDTLQQQDKTNSSNKNLLNNLNIDLSTNQNNGRIIQDWTFIHNSNKNQN